MLYGKGYYNEEGIEDGVYTDSEEGLNHRAIEKHLDGNEANADEIETAQDAEFSPALESAFISAITENYMMYVPDNLTLHRENMQLEGSFIRDCSFLVNEQMCKKYMFDSELIENAALLEGARLDSMMRDLLEQGMYEDAIYQFVEAHGGNTNAVLRIVRETNSGYQAKTGPVSKPSQSQAGKNEQEKKARPEPKEETESEEPTGQNADKGKKIRKKYTQVNKTPGRFSSRTKGEISSDHTDVRDLDGLNIGANLSRSIRGAGRNLAGKFSRKQRQEDNGG